MDGFYKWLSFGTTEKWTGEFWTDGKPIYKKTFVFNSTGSISVSNLSIDTPIKLEALALNNNLNWRPIDGYLNNLESNQLNGTFIDYNKNNGNLSVSVGGSGQAYVFTKAHVTIYYTKTTDTEGTIPPFSN